MDLIERVESYKVLFKECKALEPVSMALAKGYKSATLLQRLEIIRELDTELAEVYMDNEKQKQEVIDFLENTYTGAKMMGGEEVMLRASRALLAFKADVHKDIFIEENVLEF